MLTFMQIVERQREIGKIEQGNVSIRNLQGRFPSEFPNSLRSLQKQIYADWSATPGTTYQKINWAIVLCRFKDDKKDVTLEDSIKDFFKDLLKELVNYWRDVSFGAIDLSGSNVFDWVELDIKREETDYRRQPIIEAGIKAVPSVVAEFHSQIFVIPYGWSKSCPECLSNEWEICVYCPNPNCTISDPKKIVAHNTKLIDYIKTCPNCKSELKQGIFCINPKCEYQDDTVKKFDGGACPIEGNYKVLAPPFGHRGDFISHEMGHMIPLCLKDCYYEDQNKNLNQADQCCVMACLNCLSFNHPPVGLMGPALCLSQLFLKGWMYTHRVHIQDDVSWIGKPEGITLRLASITDVTAEANLGIKLAYKDSLGFGDYYIEYLNFAGWNKGLLNNIPGPIKVRQKKSDSGEIRCKYIALPSRMGEKRFEDLPEEGDIYSPGPKIRFQVELADPDGRIVIVTAKKRKRSKPK